MRCMLLYWCVSYCRKRHERSLQPDNEHLCERRPIAVEQRDERMHPTGFLFTNLASTCAV